MRKLKITGKSSGMVGRTMASSAPKAKKLKDDLAVLGKAITSVTLKKIVVEKVLQLMTSRNNGICSSNTNLRRGL